ncbi:MAG: hypothetical protein RLZZ609_2948 [Cyanobacteriota bacterium]
MNGLLLGIVVGLVPALLAAKLPGRRKRLNLERKLCVGLQCVGVLAMVGGSIWYLWLLPQLFISAGCGITSGLLRVLTLFTVSLPCQTSIPTWIDIAEGLMAFGTALLVYGTTRRVVLARRAAERSGGIQ